jgi:hypothetical protein
MLAGVCQMFEPAFILDKFGGFPAAITLDKIRG